MPIGLSAYLQRHLEFLYPGLISQTQTPLLMNRNRFPRTILCIETTPCSICDPDLLLPLLTLLLGQWVPSPLRLPIQTLLRQEKCRTPRIYPGLEPHLPLLFHP